MRWKWSGRLKLVMVSAALALGTLGGLGAAGPAHASYYILPVDPYQVNIGDGTGCASDNLTAWGWNFSNGEQLTVRFYESGNPNPISTVSTTASQAGYLVGFFAAGISYPLTPVRGADYTASVTQPDGLTWWATENVIC